MANFTYIFVHHLSKSGKESEGRSCCTGHGGVLLTGLLLSHGLLTCFLTEHREDRLPRDSIIHKVLGPPHESLILKTPYRLAYNVVLQSYLLNGGSLLSDEPRLCQVNMKPRQGRNGGRKG